MMSALSGWTHDYSTTHTPSLMHRDSPPGGQDQAYSEPWCRSSHSLPFYREGSLQARNRQGERDAGEFQKLRPYRPVANRSCC